MSDVARSLLSVGQHPEVIRAGTQSTHRSARISAAAPRAHPRQHARPRRLFCRWHLPEKKHCVTSGPFKDPLKPRFIAFRLQSRSNGSRYALQNPGPTDDARAGWGRVRDTFSTMTTSDTVTVCTHLLRALAYANDPLPHSLISILGLGLGIQLQISCQRVSPPSGD
jgi:hypothetical protein